MEVGVLDVVTLHAVVSLRLNVVEQLVVLVLDVGNDLLTVVELDIMWVVILVVILLLVMVVERRFVPVSVSFAVGLAMEDWLVDAVVSVEVGVVLDSVRVVVDIRVVDWVEWVSVRRVVVATGMRSADVTMGVMEVITNLVVWGLAVGHWSVDWLVPVVVLLVSCHLVLHVIDLGWELMVSVHTVVVLMVDHMALNVFASMAVVLLGGLLVSHVVDLVWEIMVVESVIIMFMINDLAVDELTVIFVAVIVFINDIMEDWLMGVFVLENIMQVLVMVIMVDFVVLGATVVVEVFVVRCLNMVWSLMMDNFMSWCAP